MSFKPPGRCLASQNGRSVYVEGRAYKTVNDPNYVGKEWRREEMQKIIEDGTILNTGIYCFHALSREKVGSIIHAWLDQDDWLWIGANIETNTEYQKRAMDLIENGDLSSFSIGYLDRGHSKHLVETSLTDNPVVKGADIVVCYDEQQTQGIPFSQSAILHKKITASTSILNLLSNSYKKPLETFVKLSSTSEKNSLSEGFLNNNNESTNRMSESAGNVKSGLEAAGKQRMESLKEQVSKGATPSTLNTSAPPTPGSGAARTPESQKIYEAYLAKIQEAETDEERASILADGLQAIKDTEAGAALDGYKEEKKRAKELEKRLKEAEERLGVYDKREEEALNKWKEEQTAIFQKDWDYAVKNEIVTGNEDELKEMQDQYHTLYTNKEGGAVVRGFRQAIEKHKHAKQELERSVRTNSKLNRALQNKLENPQNFQQQQQQQEFANHHFQQPQQQMPPSVMVQNGAVPRNKRAVDYMTDLMDGNLPSPKRQAVQQQQQAPSSSSSSSSSNVLDLLQSSGSGSAGSNRGGSYFRTDIGVSAQEFSNSFGIDGIGRTVDTTVFDMMKNTDMSYNPLLSLLKGTPQRAIGQGGLPPVMQDPRSRAEFLARFPEKAQDTWN